MPLNTSHAPGEDILAADINAIAAEVNDHETRVSALEAGGGGGGGGSGTLCRVYRNAALSMPNGGPTPIAWDAETFDTASMHDNTTNNTRIYAPTTGKYRVLCSVRWAVVIPGNYRSLGIYKNGAIWGESGMVSAGAADSIWANDVVEMTAGDYIELSLYHERGSAAPLSVGPSQTYCTVELI